MLYALCEALHCHAGKCQVRCISLMVHCVEQNIDETFVYSKINELPHEITTNVVCATSKDSDQPVHTPDQNLCYSLELSRSVKLLAKHHLEFLNFKGCCTGLSESTLVKMPYCWK